MLTDLTFVSPPRISAAQFAHVLEQAQSPAAPLASALYQIIVDAGLDPAVALAFFAIESRYGLLGICKEYDIRNWGNVRSVYTRGRGTNIATSGGSFAKYPTWEAGLHDWCERIKGRYIAERGLTTVGTVLPVYAPKADRNNPEQYAAGVVALVAQWQADDQAAGVAPAAPAAPAPTPATPAAPQFPVLDLSDEIAALTRVPGCERLAGRHAVDYITFHYSAVVYEDRSHDAEIRTLLNEAAYHLSKDWSSNSSGVYPDVMMYDEVILSDGTVVLCQNTPRQLWHCANGTGNSRSYSLHVMLGGTQDLTDAQRAALFQRLDALRAAHGVPREHVVAHCEWPVGDGAPVRRTRYQPQPGQSRCPGDVLYQHVVDYRQGFDAPAAARASRPYRVISRLPGGQPLGYANIRTGRGTNFPVAVGGQATLPPGQAIRVDDVTAGWAHIAPDSPVWGDAGFVATWLLEAL